MSGFSQTCHLVNHDWFKGNSLLQGPTADKNRGFNGNGADVLLCTEQGAKVAMHRIVVERCTKILDALSSHDLKELRDPFGYLVIVLQGVTDETLQALSHLLYTGECQGPSEETRLCVKELLSANVTCQLHPNFMDEIKTDYSNTDDVFDMNDDMSLIQNLPPQQLDMDRKDSSGRDTDTVIDIDAISQIMNDTVDGDNNGCSSAYDSHLLSSKKPAAASPCLSSSSGPKKRKMSGLTKTKSSSTFAHHETKSVETDSDPSDGPKRRLALKGVGVDTQNSKENLVKTDPKRHPCSRHYCEKRFHSASQKLRHERQIHTEKRPFLPWYRCDQCEKSFATLADAKKHKCRWYSYERKR